MTIFVFSQAEVVFVLMDNNRTTPQVIHRYILKTVRLFCLSCSSLSCSSLSNVSKVSCMSFSTRRGTCSMPMMAFIIMFTESHTVFFTHVSCFMNVEAMKARWKSVKCGDEVYSLLTRSGNDVALDMGSVKYGDCSPMGALMRFTGCTGSTDSTSCTGSTMYHLFRPLNFNGFLIKNRNQMILRWVEVILRWVEVEVGQTYSLSFQSTLWHSLVKPSTD